MYCSDSNSSSSRLPYTDKWWRLDTQQEQQFFFFKQKTAYEISACLVGSEMCIRDRYQKQSCACDCRCVASCLLLVDSIALLL